MKSAKENTERFFIEEENPPKGKRTLLFVVAICIATLTIGANFARLDEVTRGEGKVIPSQEIKSLQSLEGGIIEEFLVSEGEEVEAGQTLIKLRDIDASSDLQSNRIHYYGLMAAITRLQAEAEGASVLDFPDDVIEATPHSVFEEQNSFEANKIQLENRLTTLRQQKRQRQQEITEIRSKISDLRQVVAMTRDELNMLAPLVAKGAAPKMEQMQLERRIKEKEGEINGLESSLPRIRSSANEIESKIQEAISSARAKAQLELSTKTMEAKAIEEKLSSFQDRKTRTAIKSPVNGIVKDILVNTIGGVVRPGENIIEIVPFDDQLMVEAKIRPSDIAFIHPEQEVIIKITAYDYSIYGGLTGEVVDISADTIEGEKQEEYFYRVRIKTKQKKLVHNGESLPIIPGMVTTVEILTGDKTVMQYLIKPFAKTLGNAMKER